MNNTPIGVFDSGLGGLTVWSELYRSLPHESLVYYGDGKNCPYGNKSQQEVIGYVDYAVERLLEQGVKMIVVACNAATAMAIDHLRSKYKIPFIGLEPAVKPAAQKSKSGVIGILATAATLKGRHFAESSKRYAHQVKIVTAVGEGFVELVEANQENTPQALETVGRAMQEMVEQGADQIVLGCTHYPFLEEAMRSIIGKRAIELINPAAAVENRVENLLVQFDIAAEKDHKAEYTFCTSAGKEYHDKLIDKAKQAIEML